MKQSVQSQKKRGQIALNVALMDLRDKPQFMLSAVSNILKPDKAIIISDGTTFLALASQSQCVSFASTGLDRVNFEQGEVLAKLKLKTMPKTSGFIVDMRWALTTSDAVRSMELWGNLAERLSKELKVPVISVYDQSILIEEQMQTALRVHGWLLAASGIYENPFWLPEKLLDSATLDEQLAFMLGRVVPDYEGLYVRRKDNEMARGATPDWLDRTDRRLGAGAISTRWQIHCFGALRVLIGGQSVNWRIAGGAPKKTQTLFAYLLQCGTKGANAEQISELLWPDEEHDLTKRARLHHTIAMLRKALGFQESIVRAGDFYRLNAPPGSWIDINTFEQQCRTGLALFRKNEFESALLVYRAADQLYAGDLFESLPRQYVETENESWCLPRRMWLREMALKLQNDLTTVLMRLGRTREALDHCLKALALDPTSEVANEVAMGIFAVQGREDAVHRQFKQYQQAVKMMGEAESAELRNTYRQLVSKEKPKNAD